MSTLQFSPPHRNTKRTRRGAGLIAAGALIAIAVSIVFLSLTSAHRNIAPATTSAHLSTVPASIAGSSSTNTFRDPGTHALLPVRTTTATGDAALAVPLARFGLVR